MEEMIINEDTPMAKPTILRIVEKEIKPKLCRDRKCLIAMRLVNFIIPPVEELETELHL